MNLYSTMIFTAASILGVAYLPAIEQDSNSDSNNEHCCKPSRYFNPCWDTKTKDFLLTGDFLFWKASLTGLDGAFGKTAITISDHNQITTTKIDERDKDPNFKWRPGFRIGAKMIFKCFDTEVDWTHFTGYATHSKKHQDGRWRLRYDTLDLLFGYKFYPCSRFLVKPFLGLRGANIHQTLHSHLKTLKIDLPKIITAFTNLRDTEKFLGLGPQVGIETDWYMGRHFSLYCIVDIVNYYGHVESKFFDTDSIPSLASINVSDWKKKYNFNDFGVDGTIGIRWDKYFDGCNQHFHIMGKLGVEQHRIYDFSNLA